MKVKFSRHAKRRAKLYKIPFETIVEILQEEELSDGYHEVIRPVKGFKYPLKIVVVVESNEIVVITNFPLKRSRKQ